MVRPAENLGPDRGQADRPSVSTCDRPRRAVANRSSRRIAAGSSSSSTSSGGTFEPRASPVTRYEDLGRSRHEVQRPGERARQVARRRSATDRAIDQPRSGLHASTSAGQRAGRTVGEHEADVDRIGPGSGRAGRSVSPRNRACSTTSSRYPWTAATASEPSAATSALLFTAAPALDSRSMLLRTALAPPAVTPSGRTGGIGRNTHLRMGAGPHGQPPRPVTTLEGCPR